LRELEIPTIARKILPCDPEVERVIWAVLAGRGIVRPDLNLRGFHSAYFKSFYRKAFVGVEGLLAGDVVSDDEYRGKKAVTLSFELPGGSYATMLLKALSAAYRIKRLASRPHD
jgi:tRNA pseudouridine13 synthase